MSIVFKKKPMLRMKSLRKKKKRSNQQNKNIVKDTISSRHGSAAIPTPVYRQSQ